MREKLEEALSKALPPSDGAAVRDLRLNLLKQFDGGSLDPEEVSLALLATATAARIPELADAARAGLSEQGVEAASVEEAAEAAGLVTMLNMYYRFKHLLSHTDPTATERYQRAGLRMTALAKPLLGKTRYEMLAFAVSVLNGCETCLVAHEKVLREANVDVEKIHDLARLAATVQGLAALRTAA